MSSRQYTTYIVQYWLSPVRKEGQGEGKERERYVDIQQRSRYYDTEWMSQRERERGGTGADDLKFD